MSSAVGALVLAAGLSRRFGGEKLLAKLDDGTTVFARTWRRVAEALPCAVAVTRPELAESLRGDCAGIRVFDGAAEGIGATLAHGIGFAERWDACLVCLADMPFIESATYRLIAGRLAAGTIVVPVFDGVDGNPVGFGRRFYPRLRRLGGDAGGRAVVGRHPEAVRRIAVGDAAIHRDVDTPEDLADARA